MQPRSHRALALLLAAALLLHVAPVKSALAATPGKIEAICFQLLVRLGLVDSSGTPLAAGDITSVVAGAGLTGGATSGAATVDVAETGDAIVVAADAISAHANVEFLADAGTVNGANTFLGGDGSGLDARTATEVKTSLGLATSTTDNRLVRFDGTTGGTQGTGITVDDSDNVTGVTTLQTGDGSISAPARSYTGDTDVGSFRHASNIEGTVSGGGKVIELRGCTVTMADASATTIATISLNAGERVQAWGMFCVEVSGGSGDFQSLATGVQFCAIDKAGTLTSTTGSFATTISVAASAGTLSHPSPGVLDGTNTIGLRLTYDSSLTTPTITVRFTLYVLHSAANPTITIP